MDIIINNKAYFGRYNDNGELIISFDNDDDILFFTQWSNQRNGMILKSECVKDLEFCEGSSFGTLCNCQPILNKNLDCVKLIYDFKSYKQFIERKNT